MTNHIREILCIMGKKTKNVELKICAENHYLVHVKRPEGNGHDACVPLQCTGHVGGRSRMKWRCHAGSHCSRHAEVNHARRRTDCQSREVPKEHQRKLPHTQKRDRQIGRTSKFGSSLFSSAASDRPLRGRECQPNQWQEEATLHALIEFRSPSQI